MSKTTIYGGIKTPYHSLSTVDIDLSYDNNSWYHLLGENCYSKLTDMSNT